MEEKLYILRHSDDDMNALKEMIENAGGDPEVFKTLYQERFNFRARIFGEDHHLYEYGKRGVGVLEIN